MKPAKLVLREIEQQRQEIGSDDEFMISLIKGHFYYSKGVNEVGIQIKQPQGGKIDEGPLEAIPVYGFVGNYEWQAVRTAAESFYRSAVGSTGKEIHIENSEEIKLKGNLINRSTNPMTFEIPMHEDE